MGAFVAIRDAKGYHVNAMLMCMPPVKPASPAHKSDNHEGSNGVPQCRALRASFPHNVRQNQISCDFDTEPTCDAINESGVLYHRALCVDASNVGDITYRRRSRASIFAIGQAVLSQIRCISSHPQQDGCQHPHWARRLRNDRCGPNHS